jgi:hypothetical protein
MMKPAIEVIADMLRGFGSCHGDGCDECAIGILSALKEAGYAVVQQTAIEQWRDLSDPTYLDWIKRTGTP